MAELVLSAASGSKRAMSSLFENNKNEVYALTALLLGDEKKAEKITCEVLNQCWDKLTVKEIKTDKSFRRFVKQEAAVMAAAELFGSDIKNFRIARVSAPIESIGSTEFTGSVIDSVKEFSEVLCECDKYNRFVYLLKTAGGLSFIHIGQVIAQREAAARYFYEAAVCELKLKLSEKKLSAAADMYLKYIGGISVPLEVCEACKTAIKNRARFEMPSKRALTAIASLICVVMLGVLAAVILYNSGDRNIQTTDDSSGSSIGSSQVYSGYVPPEIDTQKTYTANIKIEDYGTIKVKLEPKSAPQTVANFVDLANKGFYNGLTFHRIMENFMMQGGDPEGTGMGGSDNEIFGEFSANGFENNLKHTAGAISMARSNAYNSASSQFFIVHKEASHLDGEYAVFGYVIEGMDIVDKICTEVQPSGTNGAVAKEDQPVIENVVINIG